MTGQPGRFPGGLPAAAALWLVLAVAALAGRPPVPVDETRVLSVAWEMWTRQDFLVPHLNGAPYSHKPPLLPWLMTLGWSVTGVNDIWPRLVAPLFALGCLWLTRRLALQLWPREREAAVLAPFFLLGMPFWALFSGATLYDMPLTFFTILGIIGLAHAAHGRPVPGLALFGAAAGLGILTKGPVILVYVALPALLAPLWKERDARGWLRWYLGVGAGLVLALAIAACWALPAAYRGGEAYARAILWGQTANRVASSFAHRHPFWWYLPVVPLLLFPWIIWPPLWRALRALRGAPLDRGIRLALLWSGGSLLVLSAVSGKQPHYLLPLFPAFALLAARAVAASSPARGRLDWLPALGIVLVGALLAGVHLAAPHSRLPDWTARIPLSAAALVGGVGVCLALVRAGTTRGEAGKLALAVAALVAALQTPALLPIWSTYDVRPAAARLKDLESRGVPVANVGLYHGQFHFLGRLERPLEVMMPGELPAWLEKFPDGRAVIYIDAGSELLGSAEFSQAFRSRAIAIVDSRQALSFVASSAGEKAPELQPLE